MRPAYLIRENQKVRQILHETYYEMLAALKHRNPKAGELIEDEEIDQLHDILMLVRLGHLKVRWTEDDEGRLMILEVANTDLNSETFKAENPSDGI